MQLDEVSGKTGVDANASHFNKLRAETLSEGYNYLSFRKTSSLHIQLMQQTPGNVFISTKHSCKWVQGLKRWKVYGHTSR